MTESKKKQNSTLVIEFFGLPGSGKTTFQNEFLKTLQTEPITIATKKDLTAWIHQHGKFRLPFFIIANPGWFLSLLIILWRSAGMNNVFNKITWRYIFSTLTIPLYTKYYISQHKPDVMLLDQAMTQNLWAIWYGLNEPEEAALANIYSRIHNLLDLQYLYFDVPVDLSAQRIISRSDNYSRFDGIDDFDHLKQMISDGTQLMILIYSTIEKMNLPIKKISGENPTEKNAGIVYGWIFSKEGQHEQ